jgi:hypothetical protein
MSLKKLSLWSKLKPKLLITKRIFFTYNLQLKATKKNRGKIGSGKNRVNPIFFIIKRKAKSEKQQLESRI